MSSPGGRRAIGWPSARGYVGTALQGKLCLYPTILRKQEMYSIVGDVEHGAYG